MNLELGLGVVGTDPKPSLIMTSGTLKLNGASGSAKIENVSAG